jgi:hypothetical protein
VLPLAQHVLWPCRALACSSNIALSRAFDSAHQCACGPAAPAVPGATAACHCSGANSSAAAQGAARAAAAAGPGNAISRLCIHCTCCCPFCTALLADATVVCPELCVCLCVCLSSSRLASLHVLPVAARDRGAGCKLSRGAACCWLPKGCELLHIPA